MPLSKTISMEEYLESTKENLYGEDAPRPMAQASSSYTMPLRTLFDATDDEMTDEERRFFNRRYQTFVDNANHYIEHECQSQADINQFLIRRLARQDAAIDRLERRVSKTISTAVEAEIDIFLGNKPTAERIRGINRRLNNMQLELKTFKDEVKSHPKFSASSEDVKAKKAAMVAAAGVANQSKKRKKAAGSAVPVGEGAGQWPDGIDLLYESMLNMAAQLRNLRTQAPATTATEQINKEEDLRMPLDGAGDDAEMADDEASAITLTSTVPAITSLTNQLSKAGLGNDGAAVKSRAVALPVRSVGWHHGYQGDVVE